MIWWNHFLKFWPVVLIAGGAIVAAWGMIIEAKWERRELRSLIVEIQADKAGYRKQWEVIADLRRRVQILEVEYRHLRDDR
jgi:hypothetical protein